MTKFYPTLQIQNRQAMASCRTLMQHPLLFGIVILAATAASEPQASCIKKCGSLDILYPFGIGKDCYLDPFFHISCNKSKTPKPLLANTDIEVLHISLDGELRVSSPIARYCPEGQIYTFSYFISPKFPLSHTRNKFIGVGCDTVMLFSSFTPKNSYYNGCLSLCYEIGNVVNGSCNGTATGCCQGAIREGTTEFSVSVNNLTSSSIIHRLSPCGFGFLVEEGAYNFVSSDINDLQNKRTFPIVLDWAVGNETCSKAQKNQTSYACKAANSECSNSNNGPGYRCYCRRGYEGNPYILGGCHDKNECSNLTACVHIAKCYNTVGSFICSCPKGHEGDGKTDGTGCVPKRSDFSPISIALCFTVGLLIILVGGFCIDCGLKRRQLIKLREKLFQQNGGLMLKQQLLSYNGSVEPIKIFNVEELKRATNNYDQSMVLGQGGNGIVYKGILSGNKVVAVKKSKLFDQSQVKQFINEIFLLSQINHRNVVKLLGCCLENEVPLLVYEFITNGTLFHHIHNEDLSSSFSWEKRIKIAIEAAGALAYLHSEASMPIIHRDVKSANILLDENLVAKVADFGASRLISVNKKQATTLVQGTHGYLDPESFQTGELTEKSDVYSFGVVLVELLTSKKVVFWDRIGNERNLAKYFIFAMKEDKLLQILDTQIVNEGNIEELKKVANLVKECLNIKGEDRPSMREVARELEGLRIMKKHLRVEINVSTEETEYLLTKPTEPFWIDVANGCSSSSGFSGYQSIINAELKELDDGR